MRGVEDVLRLESGTSLTRVVEEIARRRLLLAVVGKSVISIDSLLRLALEGRLDSARPESMGVEVPILSGRMGISAIVRAYLRSGCKYCLVKSRRLRALTPRSTISLMRDVATPVELSEAVSCELPAIVAPNATLKGAMRRMARRGSICAFVMRSGVLKGVVDVWSALKLVVEDARRALDRSCSELTWLDPICSSYEELLTSLVNYGFGALTRSNSPPLTVDDVVLIKYAKRLVKRWENVRVRRRRYARRSS